MTKNPPGRPPKGDFYLGQKFNSWTILSREPESKKHRCQCDCGAIELVCARNVVNGLSKRCRSCASKIPRKPYKPRKGKTPKIDMETITKINNIDKCTICSSTKVTMTEMRPLHPILYRYYCEDHIPKDALKDKI